MSDKATPTTTRRDMREARGYLSDLFDTAPDPTNSGESLDWVADFLLDHAHRINVQRSGDMLVLYFDLNEETPIAA